MVLGALLGALGITGACSSADSAKTSNADITADIDVSSAATGSVGFTVNLKAGRKDVDLTGDAKAVGETSDLRTTLEKSKAFGQTAYRGILYGEGKGYGPGEEITVRLERGDGSPDAAATVRLPERITISSPTEGQSVSRAQALTLEIDTGPGAVRVLASGGCLAPDQQPLELAEGEPVVLPAGFLTGGGCDVTLDVARILTGDIGTFAGGRIVARSNARVTIAVTD